ncbi:MAG: DUF2231 domain-containing protein, partial [Polyangiales bacterium]
PARRRLRRSRMRFRGHPLHPAFSHFPIALLAVVPVWDAFALWLDPRWWVASWACLCAGLVAALPAVATGLVKLARIRDDAPAVRTAVVHLVLVVIAVSAGIGSLVARGGVQPAAGVGRTVGVALTLAGLLPLLAGGFYGAKLVYEHRAGS